jgi:hypothetical protein
LCSEQSLRFPFDALFCALSGGIWTILHISFPSCRRLDGSVIVSWLHDDDVGAVYVAASDTSTPPSSHIPYMLICHCPNTVKRETVDSVVLALLILVCDIFFKNTKLFRAAT